MKMNRRYLAILAAFVLVIATFSGCGLFGNTKKTYSAYVKSLLDCNYKAEYTDYMKITGVSEIQAEEKYEQGLDYLAEALMSAYGIKDDENSNIKGEFRTMAQEIYKHAKYDVAKATKENGIYRVTVTIYPIDIVELTYDDVIEYINTMIDKVDKGDYNEYELDAYTTEYAEGILKILNDALPNVGNLDPTTITVSIIDNGKNYYISDSDFLALDRAILAGHQVNEDGTSDGPDTVEEE